MLSWERDLIRLKISLFLIDHDYRIFFNIASRHPRLWCLLWRPVGGN
jgi:hypothetical protein